MCVRQYNNTTKILQILNTILYIYNEQQERTIFLLYYARADLFTYTWGLSSKTPCTRIACYCNIVINSSVFQVGYSRTFNYVEKIKLILINSLLSNRYYFDTYNKLT